MKSTAQIESGMFLKVLILAAFPGQKREKQSKKWKKPCCQLWNSYHLECWTFIYYLDAQIIKRSYFLIPSRFQRTKKTLKKNHHTLGLQRERLETRPYPAPGPIVPDNRILAALRLRNYLIIALFQS